ncbi:MAG: glutathione S-transferase family protein [Beijerinckiaceae bacterium]|nr:glutathione S-transferase family protein [Beijerinckiaceae bacterium]
MPHLFHHAFCPHSRFIRLVMGELGMEAELVEERQWEHRPDFLVLNPAGTTPVLVEGSSFAVPGSAVIAEYLDETRGLVLSERRLLPEGPADRVEVRRVVHWFNVKFFDEVSHHLVQEKVYKRFMSAEQARGYGGAGPEMKAIRAARKNIRYHLHYIGFLARKRNWLAGEQLSYADLAAAAHLSVCDYLGDVPWEEDLQAKEWYARVKSRPSFRTLLADRLPGMAPTELYADLDF